MISLSEVPEGKLREKANYWFSIFVEWEKSKLSKSRYCQLNTICLSTYYSWFNYLQGKSPRPSNGKNLLKNKAKKGESHFIAVEMPKEISSENKSVSINAGLRLTFPRGVSLSIDKNFDPESLKQVVTILEGLC